MDWTPVMNAQDFRDVRLGWGDNGYWKVALAKDMKAVGFNIDLNKAF